MAKQGEQYQILPRPEPGTGTPKRFGQGDEPDRYFFRYGQVEVIDIIGDVITASENVEYPRGPDMNYRHVRYIEERPERFRPLNPLKGTSKSNKKKCN